MPRTRKPRPNPNPDEAAAKPPGSDEEGDAPRPSQLDQIRAAMAEPTTASQKEVPELLAPEEPLELPAPEAEAAPELESHEEAPPAAEAEPASDTMPAAAVAEPVTSPWVPPPTQPPTGMQAGSAPARPGSCGSDPARPSLSGSNLALGIVLVLVAVFFLLMRIFDVDLSSYGWPLFVIIPGLTLLIVGFVSLGTGALVPGGIITMAGLVLAYQNST